VVAVDLSTGDLKNDPISRRMAENGSIGSGEF
jgi:hypothetical protein